MSICSLDDCFYASGYSFGGGSFPVLMCLAPFAESSKTLMSQMEILFPFGISLRGRSFCCSFMVIPMAGRR